MLVHLALSVHGLVTVDTLPKSFDRPAFQSYWDTMPGTVGRRYAQFATAIAPLQVEAVRLFAAGKLRRDDATFAEMSRETLEQLGPTFIKIGQIISVREDILGPVWAAELSKLQDGIKPFEGAEALRVIEESFGSLEAFDSIELQPVAAASIAQVHRAVYKVPDGPSVDVAIKVLRPSVREQVAVDLCVLDRASDLLATWLPRILPSNQIDWRALLRGLSAALWEEVNLEGEAERQQKFAANMAPVPRVTVPAVLASSQQVMVSEWVEGTPLRRVDSKPVLRAAQGLMRDAYCKQLFSDAFFHADCHGGNLLWVGGPSGEDPLDSGELCILDCGLMVEIEPSDSDNLLRLSLHLAARDWPLVVEDATRLGFLPHDLSPRQRTLAQDVARRLVGPYLDVGGGAAAASRYSASALLRDVAAATTELPTSLPPQMVLLGRAVIQLEGLALRGDSAYRIVDDILPTAARIALGERRGAAHQAEDGSLLYELLYPGTGDEEEEGVGARLGGGLSPTRLRKLLETAGNRSPGAPGGPGGPGGSGGSEPLLELLLEADAARGLVAQEAASAIDALARDAVWRCFARLPAPPLPLPAFATARFAELAEALAPRLGPEEELVLARLPKALADATEVESAVGQAAGSDGAEAPTQLPAFVSDFAAARLVAQPAARGALREVLQRAVAQQDPAAKVIIDEVTDALRGRARKRLQAAGLPEQLAEGLQTPWGALERLRGSR